MSFNWKAILDSPNSEDQLYRLIGEMLHKKAAAGDILQIQDFLETNNPGSEAWMSLGEALFRTTAGSQLGLRLWSTWTRSLKDVPHGTVHLLDQWRSYGAPASSLPKRAPVPGPVVWLDDEDGPTTELESSGDSQSLSSVSCSSPSQTSVIRFPRPKLMAYVPEGPYSIRFLGETYHQVDTPAVLQLLRRGLLLGAEIEHRGEWVSVTSHPAFESLAVLMATEVRRVLSASSVCADIEDLVKTNKMA